MQDNFLQPITPNQVRQKAIQLLARREHSRFELQQKLQQRDYPIELIQQQLTQLVEQGLLSDERFVEHYIRARSNKGYGPIRIAAELQQRGITRELIEHFIEPIEDQWLPLAEKVRQKRFGKNVPTDFPEQAKQMRFLQYRGFTNTQISKVIDQ